MMNDNYHVCSSIIVDYYQPKFKSCYVNDNLIVFIIFEKKLRLLFVLYNLKHEYL